MGDAEGHHVPLLGRVSATATAAKNNAELYNKEAKRLLPIAGPVALQAAMGFSASLVGLCVCMHVYMQCACVHVHVQVRSPHKPLSAGQLGVHWAYRQPGAVAGCVGSERVQRDGALHPARWTQLLVYVI